MYITCYTLRQVYVCARTTEDLDARLAEWGAAGIDVRVRSPRAQPGLPAEHTACRSPCHWTRPRQSHSHPETIHQAPFTPKPNTNHTVTDDVPSLNLPCVPACKLSLLTVLRNSMQLVQAHVAVPPHALGDDKSTLTPGLIAVVIVLRNS